MPFLCSKLWSAFHWLEPTITNSWILAKDFNAMLRQSDKKGGAPLSPASIKDLSNCINDCDLIKNLKSVAYTWEYAGTMERPDWVFVMISGKCNSLAHLLTTCLGKILITDHSSLEPLHWNLLRSLNHAGSSPPGFLMNSLVMLLRLPGILSVFY